MLKMTLGWMRSILSTAFVLVVDLTLVLTVWGALVFAPAVTLHAVDEYLLPIPFAKVLTGAIFVAASFIAAILCFRFLMRLFAYGLDESGVLRIRHPVGLLLLIVLLVGAGGAFAIDEAEASEPASVALAAISWVAFCSGLWIGLRHRTVESLARNGMENVIFLRRFHSLADRSIIEVVRGSLPWSSRLVVLRSPRDLLRLWDPIQILFYGLDLRRPWRGIPVYVHSESGTWVDRARQLVRSARVVVIDASQLSEALLQELALVREVGREHALVVISERSSVAAASSGAGIPATSIVPYRLGRLRSCFRFLVGFMVVANGCVFLNLALLLVVAETFGPSSVPIAWVRSLWEALGRDLLTVLFLLGLPLYLWASWRLVWAGRVDGASARRIRHAIRARLAGAEAVAG